MPLVPFIAFLGVVCVWAGHRGGPHDFLLPRGPMSCQSTPVSLRDAGFHCWPPILKILV
ncbi:unnamed protein product, partial [Staurois parvus]